MAAAADPMDALTDSMAKLLPIEPLEMFLSIAPQGHASVSLSGTGGEPVRWRALPDKVHQVIMSMPDMDSAIVIPKTYDDKNAMFAEITDYDVRMEPYEPHDNFINRVKHSTYKMMPVNAFGYIQKDGLGHDVSEESLNQHMIVTDVTKNIRSEHGMVQKTFTPFMPNEHDFKRMVAHYQDIVDGRNVLNVVASWSFRTKPHPTTGARNVHLKHYILYIPVNPETGSLLLSEVVEQCIRQAIYFSHPKFEGPGQTPFHFQAVNRKNVTIKVAVHDFLCSTHYTDGVITKPLETAVQKTRKGGKKRKPKRKPKRNTKRIRRL
jgi:hypothetical protein